MIVLRHSSASKTSRSNMLKRCIKTDSPSWFIYGMSTLQAPRHPLGSCCKTLHECLLINSSSSSRGIPSSTSTQETRHDVGTELRDRQRLTPETRNLSPVAKPMLCRHLPSIGGAVRELPAPGLCVMYRVTGILAGFWTHNSGSSFQDTC